MRALAFTVAIVALAHATPARADDREEARREFAAGENADKHHDWQGALVHYLRANELVPHPYALFNIANDYQLLGQLREAALWYQRYLEAATDPNDRAKVRRVLVELHAKPSKLVVRSQPPGARVSIDNAVVGATPYTGVVRGGVHHVVVELDARRDERDVTLEFGEPGELAFQLGGGTGTLVVTGPPGAVVTIDGMATGVVPIELAVAPGVHRVHVQAQGFAPFDAQPIVPAGEAVRVEAPAVKAEAAAGGPAGRLVLNYLLGVTAGADVRTSDGVLLAGFGVRIGRFDTIAHAGRYGNATEFDLIARWSFLTSRVTPFIAAGYSGTSGGGGGWQATGGVRFDLSRSERVATTLLLEGGVRYFSSTDSVTGMSTSGVTIPILGSLEIAYGGTGAPK